MRSVHPSKAEGTHDGNNEKQSQDERSNHSAVRPMRRQGDCRKNVPLFDRLLHGPAFALHSITRSIALNMPQPGWRVNSEYGPLTMQFRRVDIMAASGEAVHPGQLSIVLSADS